MVLVRVAFQTLTRAAAVSFLSELRTELDIPLQIYRARPTHIKPPCAFVDRIEEALDYPTALAQRRPRADIVVLHGVFDHGDTVDQRDRFVDALFDIVMDDVHRIEPNSTVGIVDIRDDPTYVPDWIPPAEQKTYYATRFVLEGRNYTA
jgi:hypothetical protein